MYKIQKTYYEGLDETRVKLTQADPYRDFEVSFKGNLSDLSNDMIERRAIAKLAREFNPSKAIDDLSERLDEQDKSIKSILKTITLAKDLSQDQKAEILARYEDYKTDKTYQEGDKFTYNSKIYEVIQAHTSQTTWIPSETPALYKEFLDVKIQDERGNESQVIAEFKQPTGAHDAYNKGDKVSFEGKIYESKIDSNTFSPSSFPDGWNLIEE